MHIISYELIIASYFDNLIFTNAPWLALRLAHLLFRLFRR